MKKLQTLRNCISLESECDVSVQFALEFVEREAVAGAGCVLSLMGLWVLNEESTIKIKHKSTVEIIWLLIEGEVEADVVGKVHILEILDCQFIEIIQEICFQCCLEFLNCVVNQGTLDHSLDDGNQVWDDAASDFDFGLFFVDI